MTRPSVEEIQAHMWDDDMDWLQENAGCGCCCFDHTFSSCLARVWDGCRGGQDEDHDAIDPEKWRSFLGMDEDTFYGN